METFDSRMITMRSEDGGTTSPAPPVTPPDHQHPEKPEPQPPSCMTCEGKRQLLHKIRQLTDQKEKGALLVLHDPQLALSYCNRLLIVHRGKIAADISAHAPMETLEKALNILYPGLCLTENPLDTGFFCSLSAQKNV